MSFPIFKNKTVLITGHTGFKGSWLALWMDSIGAKVVGVALESPSKPSHFEVTQLGEILEDHRLDIRDGEALKKLVSNIQPDFVFHLAAQSLVSLSYDDPVTTYQTNAIGTLNLLEALRLLNQGAVRVDGQRVSDKEQRFQPGDSVVLQVGKRRFARVIVR